MYVYVYIMYVCMYVYIHVYLGMIQLVLYANIGGGRHSVLPPVTAERQTYCSPVYISHLAGVHIMVLGRVNR